MEYMLQQGSRRELSWWREVRKNMPIYNPIVIALADDVPVTQAIGDTATLGTSEEAAREDHRHGMPTVITRAQLEDTEDVLLWMAAKSEAQIFYKEGPDTVTICFPTTYTNKAVQCYASFRAESNCMARVSTAEDYYRRRLYEPLTTADFELSKSVAGVITVLAYEAVDLALSWYEVKLSCDGAEITGFRVDMATPKISVTDTAHATGYFGIGCYRQGSPRRR